MVGWQRHIQSVIRHAGKRLEHGYHISASFSSTSRVESLFLPISRCQSCVEFPAFQRAWGSSSSTISRPFYHYSQRLGISSSRNLLADSSNGEKIQSSSTPLPASGGGKVQTQNQHSIPSQVQYILKGIYQDPNKIELVAKLVRGMRVEDVLSQLQVTDKQAAKTVFQAIHSARADATYKHGLNPDRLLVAGVSIGKGYLGFRKKKLAYHGKGDGIRVRSKHQLTVILREITPEEEPEIARQRASNFLYVSKRLRLTKEENKHVPLQLNPKNKGKSSYGEGMAA